MGHLSRIAGYDGRARAEDRTGIRRRPPAPAHAFAVCLAAVLLVTVAFSQEPASPGSPDAAQVENAACAFCHTSLAGAEFCPRCGRLALIVSTSSEHRYWVDAPYVLAFPPLENAPEIQSELSPAGLVRETVHYASGDRYEMKAEKKGFSISGRVGWMKGGKETDYTAEMEDEFDDHQRLASRQVTGRLKADPDLYLYRKLAYRYKEDGRLDRIEFTTSFYRGSSDWKKSPAAWLRHSAGEIDLHRDGGGALVKIETTLREGKRSLRGEPEYGEPRSLVEYVVRDGAEIARVSRTQETGGAK